MKLNKKISHFLAAILFLLVSYLLCSTHEKPTSGYISRRKRFCSTPFYVFIILCFIFVFMFNY